MDTEELERLRVVFNKEHPTLKPIPAGGDIWKELQHRFHKICKTGKAECILSHMLSKPQAPESWKLNPEEWLSSIDIEKLEKQYMKLFPKYKFLGCIPIDFDKKSETGKCLVNALCAIKLQELYNEGFHEIGIVFNTDVSTGPGEHWIGLFCDIRPELEQPRVVYFDSYAQKPEKEIRTLMQRWKEQWAQSGIHTKEMSTEYNTTRHQYKNSECGMYCLYFHYCCLLELPMDERIPDEVINKFRRFLFRV